MRVRLLPLAIILALAAARPVLADEKKADKPAKPTIIVNVASFDDLVADAHYLAKLVGLDAQADQMEKQLKAMTGGKGLFGIDTTRPIGMYGKVGPGGFDSTGVVLLPVEDEKELTDKVEGFGLKIEKGDDGISKIDLPASPFPVYFKFANKYVYITARDSEVLNKNRLLDPSKVFTGRGRFSAVVNLDEIPKELKETALSWLEVPQANAKEKENPGETKAQKEFRLAAIDQTFADLKELLSDGGSLTVQVDLDRKTGVFSSTASLTGKPDSKLAKDIAELGKITSVAAGILGTDGFTRFQVNVALPSELRKHLGPVIEELPKKILEHESDETARKVSEPLLKALIPTAKMGEIDAGFNMRGPDSAGHYTVLTVVKLHEGKGLDKPLKELFENEEFKSKGHAKVTVDFAKVGEVSIHKIVPDSVDDNTAKMLGDNPVYLAVRDDAVILVAGPEALEVIKTAAAAAPAPGKIFDGEIALSRLAPILAAQNKGADPERVKKAFKAGEDTIHVSVEGGASLKLSLDVKTQLLKGFIAIDQATKSPKAPAKVKPKKTEEE